MRDPWKSSSAFSSGPSSKYRRMRTSSGFDPMQRGTVGDMTAGFPLGTWTEELAHRLKGPSMYVPSLIGRFAVHEVVSTCETPQDHRMFLSRLVSLVMAWLREFGGQSAGIAPHHVWSKTMDRITSPQRFYAEAPILIR